MKIVQLSVFLSNEKGRLLDVIKTLSAANITIRTLSMAENADFGIIRMVVDDYEKGVLVLRNNNIMAKTTEVIVVEVPDKPGGLSGVLSAFDAHDLNIEYMYAFVKRSGGNALMVFRVDNIDFAIEVLTKEHIKIVRNIEIGTI